MGLSMSVTKQLAAGLYAAVFNRAPDQSGLNFWVGQNSFESMAEGFVSHPVFTAQYGAKNNDEFIQSIYQNLLQGEGDAEGVQFWVELLNTGKSRAEILASFIEASLNYEGDDAAALQRKAALDNKIEVALHYTETLGELSNLSPDIDPFSLDVLKDPAYQAGHQVIATVTADKASVQAALEQIETLADPKEEPAPEEDSGSRPPEQPDASNKPSAALTEAIYTYIQVLRTHEAAVAAEQETGAAAAELELGSSADLAETVAGLRKALLVEMDTAGAAVENAHLGAALLQAKIESYQAMAEKSNAVVDELGAKEIAFSNANETVIKTITYSNLNSKTDFSVRVELADDQLVSLTFDQAGEIVVTGIASAQAVAEAQSTIDQKELAFNEVREWNNEVYGVYSTLEMAAGVLDTLKENKAPNKNDFKEDADLQFLSFRLEMLRDSLIYSAVHLGQGFHEELNDLFGLWDENSHSYILTGAYAEYEAVLTQISALSKEWLSKLEAAENAYEAAKKELETAQWELSELLSPATSKDEIVGAYSHLEQVEAFTDQIKALYANIAKQEQARLDVEAATIIALDEAGYKAYAMSDVVGWHRTQFTEEGWLLFKNSFDIFGFKVANSVMEESISGYLFNLMQIDSETGRIWAEDGVFASLDPAGLPESILNPAQQAAGIQKQMAGLEIEVAAFFDATAWLDAVNSLAKEEAKLAATVDALAQQGYAVIDGVNGVATGLIDSSEQLADAFIYNEELERVEAFDGQDVLYFNAWITDFVTLTEQDFVKGSAQWGGQDHIRELFAVQSGGDVTLYFELSSSASSSSKPLHENEGLQSITLVGVDLENLSFFDDFLYFA